ncbi:AfsR/SARP family transcriptional regulator [Streptomyces sp. GC420]|uniref:AfsR/SARP family transcriptional regulator n=1 Tax=Streptomyces sp. GC420 TaxID=2697568 RepID=UPI0014150001|nr:AfsR/SARP family transcriptional regulator [Streptomyces sp. GC420]NBM16156.1 AfsR family transcriptional regulator [Streptomyces sp. GC420]
MPRSLPRTPRPGTVRFSLLGPLSAHLDGVPLPLGPFKQRVVLAMLLSRPGTPVPVDTLTDAVWPETPPRTARKNLQVYVSSLRTLLGPGTGAAGGPGRERLVHDCGGYVLRVAEEELDTLRFRALARAADGHEPHTAARLLREALGLWQGPPLHDLRRSPQVEAEAERLELRCLTVYEDWAEAEIALGRAAAVVDGLRDLAERHPLRERLQTARMSALHRSGRQAEALAVYDDYRQLLARELGLEPGGAMTAVYRSVLGGNAAVPRTAVSAPAPAARRTVLPADAPDFTGHGQELRELLDALGGDGCGAVAVSGPAGSGKTVLAVRAAHLLGDRFPDGRFFVPVRDERSDPRPPAELLGELARLTGAPCARRGRGDTGGPDPEDWRNWLAEHRALVVLDDVPDERSVRALIPGAGRGRLVLTARTQLAGLAPVHRIAVPPLTPAESLDLLGRLVGPGRVRVDRESALRIAYGCGLLPLAVRVSGMRLAVLRHLPLSEFAARLADPSGALDELAAGDVSVRERLALGWRDLPAGSGRDLGRLAALPGEGPFTLPEAMAALGCGERQALRAVEALIDAGAVSSPDSEVTAHAALYEVPRLMRLYALERMGDGGADVPAGDEHPAGRTILAGVPVPAAAV